MGSSAVEPLPVLPPEILPEILLEILRGHLLETLDLPARLVRLEIPETLRPVPVLEKIPYVIAPFS
ncbi:hypothetical protein HMSSN139_41320 [Paenibacillus sp. HMSSN-139]|nr:hypothetical protein HMSSN139_41320 [Paenibacillus sp. HMSSN-139]